jgi:serine/threonine-protein kinase HipA
MRRAAILYKNIRAGVLVETDEGEYTFQYDVDYIEKYPSQFIIFTMPVTVKKYTNNRLFPFFEGLIPEGWLLEVASKNWKIKSNDRMGLLLACCQNCIGAVSVLPIIDQDGDHE